MRRYAFTLVELLIVVIILGILAAVVIPQFSDASTDARVSSLTTNLATIRGQRNPVADEGQTVCPVISGSDIGYIRMAADHSERLADDDQIRPVPGNL